MPDDYEEDIDVEGDGEELDLEDMYLDYDNAEEDADLSKRVPVFDYDKGDFVVGATGEVLTVTGSEAVGHIIIKAENTQRGIYSIYGDEEDDDSNHDYGSDVMEISLREDLPEDVRKLEMIQAAEEAIDSDPWVASVDDVTLYTQEVNDEIRNYMDISVTDKFGNSIDLTEV